MEEKVEQLTRQTWRAGKKGRMRKRVKPYGGQNRSEPSFAGSGQTNILS